MSSTFTKLSSGPRPLFKTVRRVINPVLKKHAPAEAQIILDWPKIMGPDMAKRCSPELLSFPQGKREGGTLIIAVDSGSSLLVQHSQDLFIEWINTYFGYQAVTRVHLKHTHRSTPSQERKTSVFPMSSVVETSMLEKGPLPPADPKILEEISKIQDPHLQKALMDFYHTHRAYHHAQALSAETPCSPLKKDRSSSGTPSPS